MAWREDEPYMSLQEVISVFCIAVVFTGNLSISLKKFHPHKSFLIFITSIFHWNKMKLSECRCWQNIQVRFEPQVHPRFRTVSRLCLCIYVKIWLNNQVSVGSGCYWSVAKQRLMNRVTLLIDKTQPVWTRRDYCQFCMNFAIIQLQQFYLHLSPYFK